MRVKGFMHQTSPDTAIEIMKSGKIISGALLGQKESGYHDNTFVYFTPVDGEGIAIPYKPGKQDVAFQFKPSLIESYPKFFLNTSQSMGPGDGQLNSISGKCACKSTYNTISSVEGPCVKKTLEDIDKVIRFDMDYCDNGPELGIPGKIDILPHLMNISIHPDTYERIKDQIPQEYNNYIVKVTSGGKRRKTRRKMSRKYCKKTPCKKMGFTQRASCRPWKNCYKNKK